MTYTIYKSSDTDAPQLSNTAGSLKTVLKACLVTGYGTGTNAKAGAGWKLVYDESYKAVFQPVDTKGENLLLRIDDTGTSHSADFSAYSAMTDINTGTQSYAAGRYTRNNGTWFVVATQKWAWLCLTTSNTDAASLFFWGNIKSPVAENKSKTVILQQTFTNTPFIYESQRTIGLFGKYAGDYHTARSALGPVKLFTGFDAVAYNISTDVTDDLIWMDITAVSGNKVIGVLPVVKATPTNFNKPTWHKFANDIYAIKAGLYQNTPRQLIMDFSHVS